MNEKASEKEMQDLRNHIASLGEGQEVLKKTLEEVLLRMENQRDEVRNDWDKIQEDMMIIFNDVKSSNSEYAGVIKQIKDVALHARIMLEDLKYKVTGNVSNNIKLCTCTCQQNFQVDLRHSNKVTISRMVLRGSTVHTRHSWSRPTWQLLLDMCLNFRPQLRCILKERESRSI